MNQFEVSAESLVAKATSAIDEITAFANQEINRLRSHIAELEKQRDEILTVMEKFVDSHEECTDFDGFTAQIVSMDDYHEAQEAIASVKGSAE